MIKCYVTDEDLKTRYPNLENQLWRSQANYQRQINKGFDRLLNDLHNLNINARQCMIPLDCLAVAANLAPQNQEPIHLVLSGSNVSYLSTAHGGTFQPLVGWGQYGLPYVSGPGQFVQEYYQNIYINLNQRRFVSRYWAQPTGSWVIQLQGNNVQTSPDNTGVPDQNDINWVDIDGATFTPATNMTATCLASDATKIFYNQFRWYRARITGTGVLNFSCWTVENIFDDAIVSSALIYILRDFVKEDGDQWSIRLADAKDDYDMALKNIHFMFDLNDDGIMTVDDEEKRIGTITMVR